MSNFTDYIDGLKDRARTLAKEELGELISSDKNDGSEFVRLQQKILSTGRNSLRQAR
jgi:hypothetical protein